MAAKKKAARKKARPSSKKPVKQKTHLDCTPQEDRLARIVAISTKPLHEAYVAAGYNDQGEYNRQNAWNVLQRPHVQEKLELYRMAAAAKLDVSDEKIMAAFAAIAFLDPADVVEIQGGGVRIKSLDEIPPWARMAIAEIKEIPDVDGGVSLQIKFHPKVPALTALAKIKNMFEEHEKNKAPRVRLNLRLERV